MTQSRLTPHHVPWTITAPTYSSNVGRNSALSAPLLINHVHSLSRITDASLVLDNGAGSGSVTFALTTRFPHTRIVATDISASMMASISALGNPNITTAIVDARTLTKHLEKESFSHVFNTFMLQTITTPLVALEEMHAVLAPGGVVGIGIWGWRMCFEIWDRATQRVDPGYVAPHAFDDPHAWRTEEELKKALEVVGFRDVSTELVVVPFEFDSPEAFTEFWFESKNPGPVQLMSNWTSDWEAVRKAMETVVEEEYHNGKDIVNSAILGTGRKP